LRAGRPQAQPDLGASVDSAVREAPGSLRALVATLQENPRAGAAFLPVAVKEAPATAGDAGYALLVNGLYSPAAAMAARRSGGELPFIMGQMMIFRRQALAAIGGLERASGQLVDDMYLGAAVAEAGMTNAAGTQTVAIVQSGMSLAAFAQTFVRWLAFARTGLPGRSFKSIPWRQGVLFWIGLLLLAAGLWTGAWPVALTGGLTALTIAAALNDLHERLAGHRLALRHAWVSSALLLAGPVAVLRTRFSREVVWRGRRYRLDREARLEEQPVFRSREA
jgi:ceramide glucosyltransferase